ncbi:hypothetical protein COOONC_01347 [Cooperia oncophora]
MISSTDTKCIVTRRQKSAPSVASVQPEFHRSITESSTPTHNRRPITTLFPAQNPTTVARSPLVPPITNPTPSTYQNALRINNKGPLPALPLTTTVCSTHGSPTVEKAVVPPPSKPRIPAPSALPSTSAVDRPTSLVSPAYITCTTPNCGARLQNLHNSPLITRNTRQEANAQAGPRVSLRARKKMRRAGVQSAIITPQDDVSSFLSPPFEKFIEEKPSESDRLHPLPSASPATFRKPDADKSHPPTHRRKQSESQTLHTNSRVVTAIDDPVAEHERDSSDPSAAAAFNYCQVWNEWNSRSGGSLPSRRSRQRPVLLDRQVFNDTTDC